MLQQMPSESLPKLLLAVQCTQISTIFVWWWSPIAFGSCASVTRARGSNYYIGHMLLGQHVQRRRRWIRTLDSKFRQITSSVNSFCSVRQEISISYREPWRETWMFHTGTTNLSSASSVHGEHHQRHASDTSSL